MNKNLHNNIDDLFKKAIEQYADAPSTNVWDAIDKNLDKKKVVSISKKYNNLKWAVAALLIFSFGMAMYTWHTKMKNKELVKQNNYNKAANKYKPRANNIHQDSMQLQSVKTNNGQKLINNSLKNIADSQQALNDLSKINGIKKHHNPNKAQIESNQSKDSLKIKFNNNNNAITNSSIVNKKINVSKLKRSNGLNKSESAPIAQSTIANANKINNKKDQGVANNNNHNDKLSSEDLPVNKLLPKEKYAADIPLIFNKYNDNNFKNLLSQPLTFLKHPEIVALDNFIAKTDNNLPNVERNSPAKKSKIVSNKRFLLSLNFFYSPEFISDDVKNDHPKFREDDKDEIKNNERTKASYSFGLLLNYAIGKNWQVQSGVNIFTRVSQISPRTLYARPDNKGNVNFHLSCSAGSAYVPLKSGNNPMQGDSIQALAAKNTLQYIGIPLSIKYTLGKGNFSFSPSAGISVNFLSKGKIETAIAGQTGRENTTTNDIEGLKSSYINSLFGFGVEYKLSKAFSLSLQPSARLALSSINKDAPVKTKLNSVGLAGGLVIKF